MICFLMGFSARAGMLSKFSLLERDDKQNPEQNETFHAQEVIQLEFTLTGSNECLCRKTAGHDNNKKNTQLWYNQTSPDCLFVSTQMLKSDVKVFNLLQRNCEETNPHVDPALHFLPSCYTAGFIYGFKLSRCSSAVSLSYANTLQTFVLTPQWVVAGVALMIYSLVL